MVKKMNKKISKKMKGGADEEVNEEMSSINVSPKSPKSFKIPFIISIVFNAILLIVLIIEIVLVLKKRNENQAAESYNCPYYKK